MCELLTDGSQSDKSLVSMMLATKMALRMDVFMG